MHDPNDPMQVLLRALFQQQAQFHSPRPGQTVFDYANRVGMPVGIGLAGVVILNIRLDDPESIYLRGYALESTDVDNTAFHIDLNGVPVVDGVSADATGIITGLNGVLGNTTERGIRHRVAPPNAGQGIETLTPLDVWRPNSGPYTIRVSVTSFSPQAQLCRARVTGYQVGKLGARNERP